MPRSAILITKWLFLSDHSLALMVLLTETVCFNVELVAGVVVVEVEVEVLVFLGVVVVVEVVVVVVVGLSSSLRPEEIE